jgi:AcrR family transcriptional regulator
MPETADPTDAGELPATATARSARTARRRRAVLEAALEVFSERGFHKGSLAEIAERVGMTHAGVLHHFGSKDQLLIDVLRFRDGTGPGDVIVEEPTEAEALLAHLVETVGENAERPGVVQAFTVLEAESVIEDHPARPYFRDRAAALRASVADALALTTGRDPADPEVADAAALVMAGMDGLQIQWLLAPEEISMQRATRLLLESVTMRLTRGAPENPA